MKKYFLLLFVAMPWCYMAPVAYAQGCTVSNVGGFNFGDVSPVSGLSYSITSPFQLNCGNYPANTNIRFCISLPSGNASTSYTPRQMSRSGGGNLMSYNFSYNASMTPIWGTLTAPAANSHLTLDLVTNAAGQITQPVFIYGSIPANQTSLQAGNFSSHFTSGANRAEVRYATYTATAPACSSISTITRFNFQVSARVVDDCTISATPLNFGSTATISSAINANNTVTVRCTNSSAYTLAANAGISGSTLPTRRVSLSPTQFIIYQLYSSSAYSIIWGDGSNGTQTLSGTGTGSDQTYTIYGRILPQTVPANGTYVDTITVTVTY